MVNTRLPDSIAVADVEAARGRLAGVLTRTPMIRLETDSGAELLLKLELLQPVRSFKVRGAYNALSMLSDAELAHGVYTASAGNMAQGLAWSARRRGVQCSVVVPDNAPATKLDGIRRLGAEIVKVPYDDWWDVFTTHRFGGLEPARFVHPVSDVGMMAGNGTIGLEILEDAPDVSAVLVPFGGGGLSCGIAAAIRASRPEVQVFGCEVDTAAPLAASIAAGRPVEDIHQTGQVRVIALQRLGADTVDWAPGKQRLLEPQDRIYVLATRAGLSQVLARSQPVQA